MGYRQVLSPSGPFSLCLTLWRYSAYITYAWMSQFLIFASGWMHQEHRWIGRNQLIILNLLIQLYIHSLSMHLLLVGGLVWICICPFPWNRDWISASIQNSLKWDSQAHLHTVSICYLLLNHCRNKWIICHGKSWSTFKAPASFDGLGLPEERKT